MYDRRGSAIDITRESKKKTASTTPAESPMAVCIPAARKEAI
jgi:hypothetical protein